METDLIWSHVTQFHDIIFIYNLSHIHSIIMLLINMLYKGYVKVKVTQMSSNRLKHIVFKGVRLLGPRPK